MNVFRRELDRLVGSVSAWGIRRNADTSQYRREMNLKLAIFGSIVLAHQLESVRSTFGH